MKISWDERFWSKVNKTYNCWTWTASKVTSGYGQFYGTLPFSDKYQHLAHRVAFLIYYGRWPSKDIDHICRNKVCVRKEHIEEVGKTINARRGLGAGGNNFRKTKCIRGHILDYGGSYINKSQATTYIGVRRSCKECTHIRYEQLRDKRRKNRKFKDKATPNPSHPY